MQQQEIILVTGASGNIGREVVKLLAATGRVRVAARKPDEARKTADSRVEVVAFDFARPETIVPALRGVSRLFLLRPPELSDANRYMKPVIDAAKAAGVRQIVFLSILGAAKNRVVPHHAIENLIVESGIPYVFLRASFFMQNMTTTHRDEIVRGEITVPAGNGRTSFIDARDVAAVAAQALDTPIDGSHAYDLTGSEALTYGEVAAILTETLNRPIRYTRPGILRFTLEQRKRGTPFPFIFVMVGIYTTCRLGLAGSVTDDTARLLARTPITMRQFVQDYREAWTALAL